MASSGTKAVEAQADKLPLRAKLGYGSIGLASIGFAMVSTWEMFFFTTFAGIDVATAGVLVSLGDICAAFLAPVWGYLSDRMYRTALGRKVGRRRLTLALTIPGLFAFMILLFTPGLPLWAYAASNFLYCRSTPASRPSSTCCPPR